MHRRGGMHPAWQLVSASHAIAIGAVHKSVHASSLVWLVLGHRETETDGCGVRELAFERFASEVPDLVRTVACKRERRNARSALSCD